MSYQRTAAKVWRKKYLLFCMQKIDHFSQRFVTEHYELRNCLRANCRPNLSRASFYDVCRLRAMRCPYFRPLSVPSSVPGLTIATPSSLAYQIPTQLHFNLSLMRLLI